MPYKIELRKDERRGPSWRGKDYLLHRGWQDVLVSGKLWGRISQQTHGCHGSTHELRQVTVNDPEGCILTESRTSGRRSYTKYKEWSDKTYKFHVDPKVGFIPLPERLTAMVKRAILAGDLRDPDKLAEEAQRELEKWREEVREREHRREVSFDLRARRVVAVMRERIQLHPGDEVTLVEEIKAAMQWAIKNDQSS